jgi:hypothetical protein
MAVMVVAVPAALVEQQLEATLRVLIVIFDKLLLREAVDHHEQHEFREWLSSRAIASFGLLQLFLDQSEGAIELKIIRLTIGTPSIVDLKFTVVELHLPARAALFFKRFLESLALLLRHWSIGYRGARSEDQAQKNQYTTHHSLALIGWLRMCLAWPIKFRVSRIFVPSDV